MMDEDSTAGAAGAAPAADANEETSAAAMTTQPARSNALSSKSNEIIGLKFTDGRVFYFHRSTLVNAGGYFAARFGDGGIPSIPLTMDNDGRDVYFVERDGELFARHILPFILTKFPGKLAPFQKDPELWRLLRREAQFCALDDLSQMLYVTHSCPHIEDDDRGVLYYLGTSKGTSDYSNPYAIGAVNVTIGGVEDRKPEELPNSLPPMAYTPQSRQAFVQYRPRILGYNPDRNFVDTTVKESCYSLWCGMGRYRMPTVVSLRNIELRLTAYSLRCDWHGMTDWNLEASINGEEWIALHKARNEQSISRRFLFPSNDFLSAQLRGIPSENVEETNAVGQSFADFELRHTWKIDPPNSGFYRFFRIIGPGPGYRHADHQWATCLHGVGLELYGDIHED